MVAVVEEPGSLEVLELAAIMLLHPSSPHWIPIIIFIITVQLLLGRTSHSPASWCQLHQQHPHQQRAISRTAWEAAAAAAGRIFFLLLLLLDRVGAESEALCLR